MHRPDDPDALAADVLYEDNHLIAINKHPGDIVQGDKTGDMPLSELLKAYIARKYNKPGEAFLGVVHRLDRPVSGVVLFARTSKALARMNELVKERHIEKIYWAVTLGQPDPPEGRLVEYLRRDEKKNKSFVARGPVQGAKEAVLDYRMLGMGDRYAFLEIKLHTGRHHQIRAQLSHAGCLIRGDLKYGAPRSNPDGSIHLHARSMSFIHPVKGIPLSISAPPPDDPLWNAMAAAVGESTGS
ncbi:MAG: RluA family pseudouridine synthase [Bacteroidales bacterium]|nr:RluA family pseudouridine synthase [Bacteroidales bacterium]